MYLRECSERAVKIFKILKQFHHGVHGDLKAKGLKHKNNLTAKYAKNAKEKQFHLSGSSAEHLPNLR